MFRKADLRDLDQIEETCFEHFRHEEEHGAFTVFRKDVYPTRKDAEKAIKSGSLHVLEQDGRIAGSVIADHLQPEEYARIPWRFAASPDQVLVLHLLLVRPSLQGRGIGTALVRHVLDLAESRGCRTVRLDTGSRNIPAVSLYRKTGFRIAAAAPMLVGGKIRHADHLFLETALPSASASGN